MSLWRYIRGRHAELEVISDHKADRYIERLTLQLREGCLDTAQLAVEAAARAETTQGLAKEVATMYDRIASAGGDSALSSRETSMQFGLGAELFDDTGAFGSESTVWLQQGRIPKAVWCEHIMERSLSDLIIEIGSSAQT